jgi:hypothetical protein
MVLAQRFKVLVLVPTIAVAVLLAVGAGIAHADAAWWVVLMAAASVASLQIGYLAGLILRHTLVVARTSRSAATSLRDSAPARRPAH